MKRTGKIIGLLLTFVLVLDLLFPAPFSFGRPATVQAALQEPSGPTEGTCGTDIRWNLEVDKNGTLYPDGDTSASPTCYTLILEGTGEMNESLFDRTTSPWYGYREVITSVSISEGITGICRYGLANLCSLTSIELPDSITSIGTLAFDEDISLQTVTCGAGLETIGQNAFYGLKSLTAVSLPEGLTTIGEGAFAGCQNLASVTLPDSLTAINTDAFSMTKLNSITIPQNVSSIGAGAFSATYLNNIQVDAGNTHFQVQDKILYEKREDGTLWRALAYATLNPVSSVTLAEGTELIDAYTFFTANKITSLTLPDTLTEIGQMAFAHCYNLESLLFPDSLKSINKGGFLGCEKIQEVVIPDSVETLGEEVFSSCLALTTVHIGKGVRELDAPFKSSKKVETVTVSSENPHLEALDNVIYSKDHTVFYYYAPMKPDTEYHLPDQVTTPKPYAVNYADSLEKLYLPGTLETLTECCFSFNKNLKSIYFAGDAPSDRLSAVSITKNSENLILYKTADSTKWDWNPGFWKGFTFAIWDPENDTLEGGSYGSVTWTYSASDGSLVFTGTGPVPDFTEAAPPLWDTYMDSIQTIEADNITAIGNYSFIGAGSLLRLEAGTSLNRIGDYAFADCTAMKFPDISAADTIGTGAFRNNSSIAGSLTLEKVSSLGTGAFQGCSSIPFVTLGACLTRLEEDVFADCSGLTTILIPEQVSAIRNRALKGCTSLRSVNIPAGVTAIGTQAFAGNTALEKAYFYGEVPADWAADSFTGCHSALRLCYRTVQTGWNSLNGSWNSIPLLGQDRFYTERQDHYSFLNTASSFGYPADYRFPKQRFVETLSSISLGTYYYITDSGWGGSCYGMAGSTLEFYENPEEFPVSDFGSSTGTLYGVRAPGDKNTPLTKLIETCQISQFHPVIAGYRGSIGKNMNNYRELVQKIEEFERAGGLRVDSEAEPIVMLLYSMYGGHAVIPVSVEQTDTGDFQVQVYDPNNTSGFSTLTIGKDLRSISYCGYKSASYVPYSALDASLDGVTAYSEEDKSLYLSIDKEHGMVTDTAGRDISEIEGAYEQKPLSDGEDDTFSGIRSFVLPEGNYRLAADVPEGQTETASPDSVTFYTGTSDFFAEISSTDENAALEITETGTPGENLVMELKSDSQTGETAAFTLVNALGMERTLELDSSNAIITLEENNGLSIQAQGQDSIVLDGQEITLQNGELNSSFIAASDENPLKTSELNTEITCDKNNRLNGTLDAEVISNTSGNRAVTITAEFFEDENDTQAAADISWQKTLNPGRNVVSLTLEELETAFRSTSGTVALSCRFTVTDEMDNSFVLTESGITVSLTGQQNPPDSGSDKPGTSDPGTSKPGTSNPGTSGGSSGSEHRKPIITDTDTDDPEDGQIPAPIRRNRTVTDIKVNVKNLTLGAGETFSLKASVLPENASDKTLRYTASNKNVTVSAGGKISARKTGSSKITITASNGTQTTVKISVKKKPNKLKLNATTKTIKTGWKFQIKAKFPKGTASHKLTYSSSKKSVATVSSTGKITARKKGTAIITVKTFNGKKAKMKVIVK